MGIFTDKERTSCTIKLKGYSSLQHSSTCWIYKVRSVGSECWNPGQLTDQVTPPFNQLARMSLNRIALSMYQWMLQAGISLKGLP